MSTSRAGEHRLHPAAPRWSDPRVRLSLREEVGHPIDGAWWPRSTNMRRELPILTAALRGPLGEIAAVETNWSATHHPRLSGTFLKDLQPVLRIASQQKSANLLFVPCDTRAAVALLILRIAAGHPVHPQHVHTLVYRTAQQIVGDARQQNQPQKTTRRAKRSSTPH